MFAKLLTLTALCALLTACTRPDLPGGTGHPAEPGAPAATLHEAMRPEGSHAAPGAAAETAVIYTCPMHPEIRQSGPGECPKCGMDLVPETQAPADAAAPESTPQEHDPHAGHNH